jgi:hypothetical protein
MGETRPVRDKFSSEFIGRIRAAGYRVNIIPLTSYDSYRFLNAHRFFGPNEPGQENLELRVHRTLTTKVVDLLLMNDLAMNRVIRGMWLQTLPTSDTRLAGTFRVTEVFRRIREFVQNRLPTSGPAACRSYLENLEADAAAAASRNTIPVPALSR